MHVQSQVVARTVRHPAAVVLTGLGQGDLRGHRQQPPFLEPLGEHLHGRGVEVPELVTGDGDVERGVRGVEHGLVDPALHVRVAAGHGQGAGEVRGVERLGLHTRVHEDQLARLDRAVVADPVQHGRVVPGRRDGVVAEVVALEAGAGEERALDDTLAAFTADRARQHGDDVLETADRGRHGLAQLPDLVLVLDEPQLAQGLGQGRVLGVRLLEVHARVDPGCVNERVHVQVHVPHQTNAETTQGGVACVLGDRGLQSGEVLGGQRELVTQLRQRGAGPHPELTVLGIRVELRGVPPGHGVEVQGGGVVAAVVPLTLLGGFHDQHGLGLVVHSHAREVRERGVRAEAIVGVVRAHLGGARGDHEALAGEHPGEPGTALSGELRDLGARRRRVLRSGPTRGHELAELRVVGALRAVVHPLVHGLRGVLARVMGSGGVC